MKENEKKKIRLRSIGILAVLTALTIAFSAAVAASSRSREQMLESGEIPREIASAGQVSPEPPLSGEDTVIVPDATLDPPAETARPAEDITTTAASASAETVTTLPTTVSTTGTDTSPTASDNGTALNKRVSRLGGSDRLDTAIVTAKKGWPEGCGTVLLANAYSYADALAGVPLAGGLKAPILLTAGKSLEDKVLEEIKELHASKVYILGGTAAVSQETEDRLAAEGFYSVRLSGESRFQTAVRISEECERVNQSKPGNIFIASSANYPDALSAGAAASSVSGTMVYCAPDGRLDNDTAMYLFNNGSGNIYILGGTAAISDDISKTLGIICGGKTERVSGADRYATALAVCGRFTDAFTGKSAVLATGDSFPDALSGGALAAKLRSPVILANNRSFEESVYNFIRDRSPETIYVMGGEKALSDYAIGCLLTNTKITTAPKPTTTTVYYPPGERKAYMTFDDGPSANTGKILDILDKNNAKATFFVIYSPKYESTYKEIIKRGHTLALHSYTHEYSKIYKSENAFWDDYKKLSDYVEKVTGSKPKYMRFPGGSSNTISRKYCKGVMSKLTKQAGEKGYRYFDWSVDSGDASGNKVAASKLINNVKNGLGKQTHPNILMHDASAKTTTVDALPEIIKVLKERGYELCAIDENTPDCHQKVNN